MAAAEPGGPAPDRGGGGDEDPLLAATAALLGPTDVEGVHERIVEVLAAAAGAGDAALWTSDEAGLLLLRASAGAVDRALLPARLDPRVPALDGALAAGMPFVPAGGRADVDLALPLVADGEPLGLVQLGAPTRGAFAADAVALAARLATVAALALRNARRLRALEHAGLRDRETGAYHLAYFADHAGKEFYKARRYGRSFSVVVLTLDDLDTVRQVAGPEAARAAARGVVAAASRVARDADVLARASDREYQVLLPETDPFGAQVFVRRVADQLRREPALRELEGRCAVRTAVGAATFPRDGEAFEQLLAACRERQRQHRASLVQRLPPRDAAGFWDLADALLAGAGGSDAASTRLPLDVPLLHAVQRELAREIGRDPRARRVVYVGGPPDLAGAPLLSALPPLEGSSRSGDTGARVFLLSRRGATGAAARGSHPLVTEVPVEGDLRMRDHAFVLFLSEGAAYALLHGPAGAFHTCDAPLVDALAVDLQAMHELVPL